MARHVRDRRGVHRRRLQPQADRRALLQRAASAATPASKPAFRTSSPRRATTTATAPTPPPPPAAINGVPATGDASAFGKISGIAPRARIAVYKACWHDTRRTGERLQLGPRGRHRPGRRRRRRRDQLSRSAARARTSLDPVEIAFLFAADAGVFVAASAGNSGPTVGTVAHPRPWITTVAAGTHNRDGTASVTLGNGATYTGASYTPRSAEPAHRRVARRRRRDAGRRRALLPRGRQRFGVGAARSRPRWPARSCVCDRGVNARVNKSAGGEGGRRRRHDPGQHADRELDQCRPALRADRASRSPRSAPRSEGLRRHRRRHGDDRPRRRSSSTCRRRLRQRSRRAARCSPAAATLLKPDVIAPGQDILAGVAPPGQPRSLVRHAQRHVDVEPARRRLAALMKEAAPGLVADGDQVGADDDRLPTCSTDRTPTRW